MLEEKVCVKHAQEIDKRPKKMQTYKMWRKYSVGYMIM